MPRALDAPLSLYIVVVPFFFTCSSFLFFRKFQNSPTLDSKRHVYRRFAVRVLSLYGIWTAIYFPFVLFRWLQCGISCSEVIRYMYRVMVFTSYPTIWFLHSLVVAVTIVCLLQYIFSVRAILITGAVCYIVGALGYSYAGLTREVPCLDSVYEWLNAVFLTTRNGLFNGFPYAALGAYIAVDSRQPSKTTCLFLSAVFCVLFVSEAFLVHRFYGFPVGGADTVLCLLPFTYFSFQWMLQVQLVDRPVFRWMRDVSILVFLGQRLFLTAIPSVCDPRVMAPLRTNAALGMFVMVTTTVVFASSVVALSKRYGWLKNVW